MTNASIARTGTRIYTRQLTAPMLSALSVPLPVRVPAVRRRAQCGGWDRRRRGLVMQKPQNKGQCIFYRGRKNNFASSPCHEQPVSGLLVKVNIRHILAAESGGGGAWG